MLVVVVVALGNRLVQGALGDLVLGVLAVAEQQ
jgi:hypothetical protein